MTASTSTFTPPSAYICPLTKNLMKDPMLSKHGQNFERVAILNWLYSGNTECPVTGKPLRVSNLVSNKTLKWKIQLWTKEHGISEDGDTELSKSEKVTSENMTVYSSMIQSLPTNFNDSFADIDILAALDEALATSEGQ
jgi:hypothetical protein